MKIVVLHLRQHRRYGFAAVGAYTIRLGVHMMGHRRHGVATGTTMGAYTARLGVHMMVAEYTLKPLGTLPNMPCSLANVSCLRLYV